MAKLLGCHATSVANWESGVRQPRIRELARVIEFLGYDPRPEVATLGERLARRRTAMGVSQTSAAERLSVDPSTLARWESGRRQPEGRYLAKVLVFLGGDPRPAPATIAGRLKRWREALGWSQRELARRIGVCPSTVERWELGRRVPRGAYLAKVNALIGTND
jgi:transcriptional regulator with XRE-family HTH domain